MRTLEDKKLKNQNKRQDNSNSKPQNKQQLPKKIVKTIFSEPYSYKLEVLSHQDSAIVKELVIPYLQQLRKIQPENKDRVFNEAARQKVISFKNKIEKPCALHETHCVIGIKCLLKRILAGSAPDIVIIYFDPKNFELFEQLFVNLLIKKVPYILLKANEEKIEISRVMGINVLNAYGLYTIKGFQQTIQKFKMIAMRCFVQVPHVFQSSSLDSSLGKLESTKIEETTTLKPV